MSIVSDEKMATRELRELRHRYRTAYTAYMSCVHVLSDASEQGEWPPNDLLTAETSAHAALVAARDALLHALWEHSRTR